MAELSRAWDLKPIGTGTWANGRAPRAELKFARTIGSLVHRCWGMQMLLTSRLGRVDTPAFDGLITDRDGRVVANCSLKQFYRLSEDNGASFERTLRRCEERSGADGWARDLTVATADLIPRAGEALPDQARRAAARETVEQRFACFADTFVDTPRRPLWMFTACERMGDSGLDADAFFARLTERRPHLTHFLIEPRRIRIHRGGRAHPPRHYDCATDLLGTWRAD